MIEVAVTRDSVCLADDVDSPHMQSFIVPEGTDLLGFARILARSSYLPMPSDAWGWVIEAQGAVVAVRKGFLRRWVDTLRGEPASVTLTCDIHLSALYVQPESPWRKINAREP